MHVKAKSDVFKYDNKSLDLLHPWMNNPWMIMIPGLRDPGIGIDMISITWWWGVSLIISVDQSGIELSWKYALTEMYLLSSQCILEAQNLIYS